MKIYLSGIASQMGYLGENRCNYGLIAFPEVQKAKNLNDILSFCNDIFLDSGGYSIRIRGLKLSVVDYANFINKYSKHFSAIANMDTGSVEETISNQKFLEKETQKNILPVYHYTDFKVGNIKLLEEYCEKYDYIALGGVAGLGLSQKQKDYYLGKSFQIAIKTKTKIHGFGITNMRCLIKYPFYSVDSTSWLQGQKYNQFTIFKNGQRYKYTAKEYRDSIGLDPAKNSNNRKISESKKQREKFNNRITKLHQAKGMEYRL